MKSFSRYLGLVILGLITSDGRAMHKVLPISEIQTMSPDDRSFALWQELLAAGELTNIQNLLQHGAQFPVSQYFQFYHNLAKIPKLDLDHLDGASILTIALEKSHAHKKSEEYMVRFLQTLIDGGVQYKYEALESTEYELHPLACA